MQSMVAGPGDSCNRGFVGMLSRRAPGCLTPCAPDVCPAVASAIGAYMKRRKLGDVKEAVCADQQPFRCLLKPENAAACKPIFDKAKAFGLPLPGSTAELQAQCGAGAMSIEEADPVAMASEKAEKMAAAFEAGIDLGAMQSMVAGPGDSCNRGFVGMLSRQAPGCLTPCAPDVCPAVASAIGAYMKRRKLGDVKEAVCADQQPFRCLLKPENAAACKPIFDKAKAFGLPLPGCTAELQAQCGAGAMSIEEADPVAMANEKAEKMAAAFEA